MDSNYPPFPPGNPQHPQLNNDDNGPEKSTDVENSSSTYVSSVPRYSPLPSSSIAGGLETWDSSSYPTSSTGQFPHSQSYEAQQYQLAPSEEHQGFPLANQSSLAQGFEDLSIKSSPLDRNVDLRNVELWSPSVFSTGGHSNISLHHSYILRPNEEAFYVLGRVFSCVWTETVGATVKDKNGDHFSDIWLGLTAYSDNQRFVVVRPNFAQHFSLCLPIKTYGSKGSGKFGLQSHLQHAIIYTGDTEPQRLKTEQEFTKIPIRMLPANDREVLRTQSRLNFGKPTPVDHNHLVKHVGDIGPHHLETLRKYYDDEHCIRLSSDSASLPNIEPSPVPPSVGSKPMSPSLGDVSSLSSGTNAPFASTGLFTAPGGPHGHGYSNEPTQTHLQSDQQGTGYGYQTSVPNQNSFSTYETNRPSLPSSLEGKEAQRNKSKTTPRSNPSAPGSNQRSKHPSLGSNATTFKEGESKKSNKPLRRK